ncbi:MAG TPA: hypothetical protein VK071_13215 [Tissierellales bacterium]|nr:hypothetical protein [Tissierellales bacterium]
MKEEKKQILKMVEENKITVDEGLDLLNALEEREKIENTYTNDPKWLKIKVFDPDEDTKVNVNLPLSLINVGMKMSQKFVPELKDAGLDEEDFKEILNAIEDGAQGKIVDIESEDGEKVEIVVE